MPPKPIRQFRRRLALAALLAAAKTAHATEGYFLDGVGAREQALGGAGVASSVNALSIANNPAGLVEVGRQFNVDVTAFNPNRDYTASGTLLVAPGQTSSGRSLFAIPALGYAQPLDASSSFGVAAYGNGGMNTSYVTGAAGLACPTGAYGVFCSGHAGVDLQQAFFALAYARRFGDVSLGVAPILAVQSFQAYGLGAFGGFGLSADATALSNRGVDYSVGGGVRLGAQWRVNDAVTLGLSGTTPIWSSAFSKYSGLFAGGGQFDIPAEIVAGLAWRVAPNLLALLDYKHIFYGQVNSIAHPLGYDALFGSADGPGFGWKDVDVIAFGLEWRALERLTLRAGYAYNSNPITAANVTINILAPGVVTNHLTGGFSLALDKQSTIDFSAQVSPRATVSGVELTPYGATPGSKITIGMNQFAATLGYAYRFAEPPVRVAAKY